VSGKSAPDHSIPWAMHSRPEAKKKRRLLQLSGNLIDKCTQNVHDGQTNGLIIGPHASNLISEIILTAIDKKLQDKGYQHFKRYIDDYKYFATSCDDALKFLKDLGLCLREYELTINEKKTNILRLPRPSEENWVRELNRFAFPKDEEIPYRIVRSFMDLALELAQASGTSAPINYAMKMIPEQLDSRAKRLYVQEAINHALTFPYLVPLLEKYVFMRFWYDGIEGKIHSFANHLISIGIDKLYPDSIAYSLYFALKYGDDFELELNRFKEIVEFNDCLATVLLREYVQLKSIHDIISMIDARATELKLTGDKNEVDRQWLLVYQCWTPDELRGNGQTFLAELKSREFKFVEIEKYKPAQPSEAKAITI
jgi:hypothetical protein